MGGSGSAPTFKFSQHEQRKKLNIEGNEFEIVTGDIEALTAGQELAERLKTTDVKELGVDAYRKMADEIKAAVDQVLGAGASDKIIGGRRPTITGLVYLLAFVLQQSTADVSSAVDALVADLTEVVTED